MIHYTSICESGARIGVATKVWHFCHIVAGAEVGPKCVIGQGCFIAGRAKLGTGVRLQNNVSVYDAVQLGDYVFCGPSVVFTNVRTPRAEYPRREHFEATTVERGASLGANSTIRCGVRIGRYALVGAGAVVTQDVPAFAMVQGNPCKQVGWVGRGGTRLRFDEEGTATCPSSGFRYLLRGEVVEEVNDAG